jgi:hypothetical protein
MKISGPPEKELIIFMKYNANLPQFNADVLQTVKSIDVRVILVICTQRKQFSMSFLIKQKR